MKTKKKERNLKYIKNRRCEKTRKWWFDIFPQFYVYQVIC